MSPALAIARMLDTGTIRGALLASYRGALKLGAELQGASLAGKALVDHPDIDQARAAIGALQKSVRASRKDGRITDYEWALCDASTYLSQVADEERGRSVKGPARYMCGRSDEGDSR